MKKDKWNFNFTDEKTKKIHTKFNKLSVSVIFDLFGCSKSN